MIFEEWIGRAYRKVRKVSKIILWHTILKARQTITVRTKQGVFTVLTADDFIGKSLFCFEHHEKAWMENAIEFLRSIGKCPPQGHGTMVDIGANNGCTSVGMLLLTGVDKSIAIEPDPSNFSLLEHNVRQNNLADKIICVHRAVSSQEGEMELELSKVNFGDHRVRMVIEEEVSEGHHESKRKVVRVRASRLDDLLKDVPESFVRDIAFVWIDVQGHEGYAFEGAEQLLRRDIPVVSEFWPYGIRRAGMSQKQFVNIAKQFWSTYWVTRKENGTDTFVSHAIDSLDSLFDEIGYNDDEKTNRACNIIFTK